ncbi:MAG: alpha/beta hydrolase [Cyclobacteriaceae bacterium]
MQKKDNSWLTLMMFILLATGPQTIMGQTNISELIQDYRYPVNYTELDGGGHLAYLDEGEGDFTLVFIHGLGTHIPAWYPTIDSLKSKYRCIVVDLPGYGRSSFIDGPASMKKYASAVLELVKDLKLDNPVLVGHSMGGQIAMTAVLQEPGIFEKLVLLAPAGFETFTSEQAAWLKSVFTPASVLNSTEAQLRVNWSLNFYKMPANVEFMIDDRLAMAEASDFEDYASNIAGSVSAMLDEPVFDRLSDIETETLVVYGENDSLIPNKYINPQLTTKTVAESGTAQLQNATLHMIPECGHFIAYDCPDVSKLIDSFLSP